MEENWRVNKKNGIKTGGICSNITTENNGWNKLKVSTKDYKEICNEPKTNCRPVVL